MKDKAQREGNKYSYEWLCVSEIMDLLQVGQEMLS